MPVSPWAQPDPNQLPPGMLAPVSMGDPGVDLHAGLAKIFPPPTPQVSLDQNPQDQIQGAIANGNVPEASRLNDQQKLVKDIQKDADPYGSPDNHPGFFGKLAHALSHATGGDTRRGWEEQGLAKQINQSLTDEADSQYKAAQTGNVRAETGKATEETSEMPEKAADTHALTQSQITEHNAQAAALLHPQAKTDFEAWQQQNPGKPIEEWLKALSASKVEKPDPARQQLVDEYQKTHPGASLAKANEYASAALQAPQRAPIVNMFVPGANGTETLQTIRPGESIAPGAMTAGGVSAGNAADMKANKAQTQMAENLDSDLGLMKQFASHPSATNDAAMLMHYIGATKPESMGKIRLSDREIKLFGGTRSLLGDGEALLSKVQNGQMLTPEQRNEMISTMSMIATAAHRGGESSQGGQSGAPKDGDTKVNSAGIKVKFSNGKWGPA